jgi:hypothetical protein
MEGIGQVRQLCFEPRGPHQGRCADHEPGFAVQSILYAASAAGLWHAPPPIGAEMACHPGRLRQPGPKDPERR